MFSSTQVADTPLTASTLRFTGFSSNSLFVQVKHSDAKLVPHGLPVDHESSTYSGKENIDSLKTSKHEPGAKTANPVMDLIRRHLFQEMSEP